jgi:hypothetical protein
MAVGCCAQRILTPCSLGRSSVYRVRTASESNSLYRLNAASSHYNLQNVKSNLSHRYFNRTNLSQYRQLFTTTKLSAYARLSPQEVSMYYDEELQYVYCTLIQYYEFL